MKSQEQLQEQYEDAYFALLMAEFARSKGKSAWEENERLKKDPNAEVPKEVDIRCQKAIRHHFAKRTAQNVGRITIKTLKQVAAVVGIAAILFISAFAASETVRVNTMNLIIDVFGESTDLYFQTNASQVVPEIKVGWLPEGFSITNQEKTKVNLWYEYRKSEKESIVIKSSLSEGTVLSLDTEDAEVEYVDIHGINAMLIKKVQRNQIVWIIEDKSAFISIIGEGVDEDDLIHIATEIEY